MDENQPLIDLYARHLATIRKVGTSCGEEMEGPFLIAPGEAYWKAKPGVAFVGQETHGWTSEEAVATQMAIYRAFNLGAEYYASPFWSVIRKLEAALTGGTYNSAWLNLNRYDEAGGKPSAENQARLAELDFLLLEELRIVGADVVILFTGPGYDERTNRLLGSVPVPVAGFPPRQLCQLESSALGGVILRTYHPNYLRRSGLEPSVVGAIGEAWQAHAGSPP